MGEKYGGRELEENKAKVLDNLHNLERIIAEKGVMDLPIIDLTSNLVITLTETKDKDLLDVANKVNEIFLEKIKENMGDFTMEQLPTIFAALQLFAVEAGQYDFEITDNPDSEVNKLIEKYANKPEEYLRVRAEYEKARDQLKKAKVLRGKAISALLKLFEREEFFRLRNFIEDELFPLIKGLNNDKRYRPFRVAEATKIGDKIYRFMQRTKDKRLKNLLQLIYDKKQIRFGTSGFRAFINKDFTQRKSDIISLAICNDLKTFQKKEGRPIIITYDTRMNAREFAVESAKVFLAQGFPVKFAKEASPTGALVYWLIEEEKCEAAGGENMTPSHNPLPMQGQRWNLHNGDVAPTSVTDRIEREANLINLRVEKINKGEIDKAEAEGRFVYIDMKDRYTSWVADFLKEQEVNIFDKNGSILERKTLTEFLKEFYSNPEHRFIHNAMNGAARGYISEIFEKMGIPAESVFPMDSYKDEFLGLRFYANPEEQWLIPTIDKLKLNRALFESATDTDGDRCGGVLDEKGFVNLNKLMAMLADFIVRGLGWEEHMMIRTGTTSTALDDVAAALKLKGYKIETPEIDQVNSLVQHPFYEIIYLSEDAGFSDKDQIIRLQKFPSIVTEVGFKYISAAMKKYDLPAAVAGEESGGFTIMKFPDKDGIMGICLIAAMIAWHGKKPSEIWGEHIKEYGEKYDKRLDIWIANIPKEKIINSWLNDPQEEIAGQKVLWVGGTRYDKIEFILLGAKSDSPIISRLLIRASGTEEMNRVYIESGNEEILKKIENFILNRLNNLILEDIASTKNYYDLAEKIASNGVTFMSENDKKEYFEAIKQKMDELANLQGIEPIEIYRNVLKLLTIEMDRDINIRHAAWGVDISIEYYRHIFGRL